MPSTYDRAGGRLLQAVQAAQQRGFAGAGRADDEHQFAFGDGEVDALQDVKRAEMLVERSDIDDGARGGVDVPGSARPQVSHGIRCADITEVSLWFPGTPLGRTTLRSLVLGAVGIRRVRLIAGQTRHAVAGKGDVLQVVWGWFRAEPFLATAWRPCRLSSCISARRRSRRAARLHPCGTAPPSAPWCR